MFNFNFTRREQLGAIILSCLLILGLLLRFFLLPPATEEIVFETDVQSTADVVVEKEIVVHVTGAVIYPGVYRLPEGARVYHAIEAAGGVTATADQEALNLAAPLFDGQKVRVPLPEEEQGGSSGAESDGRININTATAADFEKLPGIGPVRATAIVDYREKNGPFRRLEDMAAVTGIGPKTLEGLKELVTLY